MKDDNTADAKLSRLAYVDRPAEQPVRARIGGPPKGMMSAKTNPVRQVGGKKAEEWMKVCPLCLLT
jgi:hypothetical protein